VETKNLPAAALEKFSAVKDITLWKETEAFGIFLGWREIINHTSTSYSISELHPRGIQSIKEFGIGKECAAERPRKFWCFGRIGKVTFEITWEERLVVPAG
jgi:hypothetical protein